MYNNTLHVYKCYAVSYLFAVWAGLTINIPGSLNPLMCVYYSNMLVGLVLLLPAFYKLTNMINCLQIITTHTPSLSVLSNTLSSP